MAQSQHTPSLARLEEAVTVLFCLIDDAYALLNPRGKRYGSLKRLSDSEIVALALLQQLRGVESERSFLRDAERFFSHLFPGVKGLDPSSFNRRVRKLRCFLEPLRREILPELVGEPETLIVDSTLLEVLHPRQVSQSAGFEGATWVRWGCFSVYGLKLHLLCATNRVLLSYELTPAHVAEVRLAEELLVEATLSDGIVRRLLGDLAYRSAALEDALAKCGVLVGDRTVETAGREAAGRDRAFEPQAGPWTWRDASQNAGWVRHQDLGEDDRLHLRLLRQSPSGASSRQDQGIVGLRSSTSV
jgi:hypothetical protein